MTLWLEARKKRSSRKYVLKRKRFLAENRMCNQCEGEGVVCVATELDHIIPACTGKKDFWDEKNWQSLCKRCHKTKSDREKTAYETPEQADWNYHIGNVETGKDKAPPPQLTKTARYDPDEIIRYVEKLKITEGPLAGTEFKVLDWEAEAINGICEKRTTAISMARGNGKTTFIAGIACAAIDPDGPLFSERGEVVIVARLLKQAGIAFEHVRWFLNDIIFTNPNTVRGYDSKIWQISNSQLLKFIQHKKSGTKLMAVGGEPGSMHGIAPSLAIGDEPAQWQRANDRDVRMKGALDTSLGKQTDAKMFFIGTRADDASHWFNRILDKPDSFTFSRSYHADDEAPPFSKKTIRAANPSYDHFAALQVQIEAKKREAKDVGGSMLATYKALHLNMGSPETDDIEMLVEVGVWRNLVLSETPPEREGPVFIGIDMGDGTSMTAFSAYWAYTGLLEAWGAYPRKPTLKQRGLRDGVGGRYVEMAERGELFVMGEYNTDSGVFLQAMFARMKKNGVPDIRSIEADNYKKTVVRQALFEAGLDPETLSTRRVGRGPEGGEDITAFKFEVNSGHMKVAPNLIIDAAIANSVCARDTNGNSALNKQHQKGRIDVLQAAVLAVGAGNRWRRPPANNEWDVSAMVG